MVWTNSWGIIDAGPARRKRVTVHSISPQRAKVLPVAGLAVVAALSTLLACTGPGADNNGATSEVEPVPVSNDDAQDYDRDTGPRVRVNQLGYLPDGPKRATLVTDADQAVDWQLRDGDGGVVAEGQSSPQGHDPSVGLTVHTIGFSEYTGSGTGYTLSAENEQSYDFDIVDDLYASLRYDALNIYYPQRSGTAIEAIEVDGVLQKQEYERPAGHTSEFLSPHEEVVDGNAPNRGDHHVPCLPAERFEWDGVEQHASEDHYGPGGWECPEGYALDVAGGWYDAGDHGKYVVNSGISIWQLLATYERNQSADLADDQALGDETLLIPERGNEVPDILDEARWNLEWMLAMQVPEGTEMIINGVEVDVGGMAHHKVHDIAWAQLPTLPHKNPMPRYLHRPSTAATLNLTAVAAHGARLYDKHDPAFAEELLEAAEAAWEAANEHDNIFRDSDEVDPDPGGGPYNDHQFSDEFYWAAAQLFLTTGGSSYEAAVLESEHHVGGEDDQVFDTPAFDWQATAGAARLDLATVDSELEDHEEVIESVIEAADAYMAIQDDEPFGHPYSPEEYHWGSNHMVLNNASVIATAFDLTGEADYRDAAIEAIDYVLGRNAVNNSYVKGYGTSYSQSMHGRWYAHDHDRLPPFPDGKLAGGANSGIDDPVIGEYLAGCAPQLCYLDHPESWSTNETTINWNSALAWYASWLADLGRAAE